MLDHAHPRRRAGDRERDRHRAHRVAQLGRRALGVGRLAPVLERQRDRERLEVVEQREVGDVAGGDRAAIEQPVGARAVQRGHHEHVLGRDALGHRDPAHLVDVALAVEEVRLAVVGAERAVVRPVLAHHRQQVAQVARVGGLADQHPHAAPALLQRLGGGERLVVGGDARGDVRVQRRAGHARRVPVDVRRDHPREHVRIARDDAREVHHLGHAERARMAQDLRASRPGPSGPQGDSKSDAGTHDGAITNTSSGSPSVAPSSQSHALDAGHVGDLVRVADDRGRAARHDRARELRGGQLRRLEVHVRVDEARHEVAPRGVDPLAARRRRRRPRSARPRSRRRRRATRA